MSDTPGMLSRMQKLGEGIEADQKRLAELEAENRELRGKAEQDGKRIAEMEAENVELHSKLAAAQLDASIAWGRYETANKSRMLSEHDLMEQASTADARVLTAAEAMKEAAANVCQSIIDDESVAMTYEADMCLNAIRALSCVDVIGSMK